VFTKACHLNLRGCIQKFPDWSPGARTANGTALCHQLQLYRYFMSQSSEFCRHNTLCCFSMSVYCCLFRYYGHSAGTFGYTLVFFASGIHSTPYFVSRLVPSNLPIKIFCAFLTSIMRATYPAHLIILDFIMLIILSEEYKLWSPSLCNFYHPPVTFSLFYSHSVSLCSSLRPTPSFTFVLNNRWNYSFIYITFS
jgi:hypothetical protein